MVMSNGRDAPGPHDISDRYSKRKLHRDGPCVLNDDGIDAIQIEELPKRLAGHRYSRIHFGANGIRIVAVEGKALKFDIRGIVKRCGSEHDTRHEFRTEFACEPEDTMSNTFKRLGDLRRLERYPVEPGETGSHHGYSHR